MDNLFANLRCHLCCQLLYKRRLLYDCFSGDVTDCTFRVGEQTYTPVEKDGLWYVEIANIALNQFDTAITLNVVCDEETIEVVYGPMNYIERVYEKTASAELKDTLVAMYYYYTAVVAYLNSVV